MDFQLSDKVVLVSVSKKSKLYSLAACLAALSLLGGCFFSIGFRGSGIVKTETREVAAFSSISSETVGRVIVQQTGKESLKITADDNILPLLKSSVADNVLYLSIKKDASFNPTKLIQFIVEVKNLESLNIKGVGSLEVKDIQGKKLSISLDGVGSMTITGSVDVLELTLSGVGSFHGEEFKTKQATVRNNGVGTAVVNVSEKLDATASGVGSIEYIGSPEVQSSVRGVGTVKKR